ncbi:hypothetical protein ABZ517_05155 [Streptomyces scabiei]|uniref:hypothetical protein n=1 Tax=Streptomyces scabiei TaxID=1930 RepID=UPI0033E7BFE7
MADVQTCPRRTYEMGPWERGEGLDTWSTRPGNGAGPSCSFCGSLHPDRFMELVHAGWIVGPTDKSYKAYLCQPLTDEEKAEHKARWMDGFTANEIRASAKDRGTTPEQVTTDLEALYEAQVAPLAEGTKQAKFYFQHLSEEQQHTFIDLHNSRQMQVGYPGHFYQLPYFMRLAAPEETRKERE